MPGNAIWAVTGPEHDASMARELAWIATGGQTGVVGPWSCEVRAQPTPGNTVRIMPGGFAIAATSQSAAIGYTSAPWQSYMRSIREPVTVDIDATGSSGGRTDVVGFVVDDPEFEGTSPDPDTHQYWRPHVVRNAGNGSTRPEHFASLSRPFIPLAQVRIPSSTATITSAMIYDLRQMAIRRTESRTFVLEPTSSSGRRIGPGQTTFTDLESITISDIPSWATRVVVDGELTSLIVRDGSGSGTSAVGSGRLRGQLTVGGQSHQTPNTQVWQNENWERFNAPIAGNLDITPGQNSGTFTFQMRYGAYGDGDIQIHEGTYFSCFYRLRLTFEEAARTS